MEKMIYDTALMFADYPERVTASKHYIWARKLLKKYNVDKLTIGIGNTFYPYYFVDNYMKLDGFEVDLCKNDGAIL